MSKKDSWIPASEALEIMTREGESPIDAGETLATYLRFGKLKARAAFVWSSEEPELRKAWKPIPDDAQKDVELPTKAWQSHKDWARDVSDWRWPFSSFHVTKRMKPKKRKMMRHVEFNLHDLKKIQPAYFSDKKRAGKRGPAQDVIKRSLVWGELFEMALSGQLTDPVKKEFETQTDLEGVLYARLNKEGEKTNVGKNIISEVARSAYPKITS